ncbi:MAG TPA: hypothetical protein VLZ89_14800 [Anaerolineales bacterium]|nr:hypothetical protein [Anaerolineales bacterium]
MRRILRSPRSIPAFFALITLIAYGLLLPFTGFYWDDWPFAWAAQFLGPSQFIPSFAGFRPFLGPIFFLTTSLIPANPVLWQTFALIIRFLAGCSAWFALDQIWPRHEFQTLIASLLFLIFPGFSQHWVAYTHINQEWIPLIFYLLSFGFTARALRNPERNSVHTIAALLLLIAGLFPTEYFIGLEPMRFLFIWVILGEETKGFWPRLGRTLKRWWPYLLIWTADALWLAYYYKSGAYVSYGVTATRHAISIQTLLLASGDAFWKAGLYVWVQVLVLTAQSATAPTSLLTFVLILLSFLSIAFYVLHLEFSAAPPRAEGRRPGGQTFAVGAVVIGLTGILLGRVPSFAAGLPLTLQSSYDRFMISMMLGASLFATGLIDVLIRDVLVKTYVFALLIALGVGQQFFNANIFRRDWARQQDLYWELGWRIPALKPDTAILTDFVPIDYETDLSFTAPINWMYAPNFRGGDLPYAMVYVNKRLGGASLSDLKPDTAIDLPYRTVTFHGSTSQVIVIYAPPNGCLRVLDPIYANAQTYNKFASLTGLIPLSDPSRIITDAPPPGLPNPPFPAEPAHTWCYFYERAELARQIGDWPQVAQLGGQALQRGYVPQDDFEWLPFIEADARTGDVKSAEQITRQAWKDNGKLHQGLCLLWERVQAEGPAEVHAAAANLLAELGCR